MTLRELVTKIGFKVDEQEAKGAEDRVKKMSLGMKAGILGVAAALFGIGVAAVNAAGDMEMLTTQFEVMLGSTEKAVSMMDELKTFAASTPFALQDLATGTQQLLSFGVAENDVIEAMKLLGDTAGGNAEKLNGLVLAYGKVQAKGKASMEEINMLTERGVPIISTLREQLGVTEDAFFKLVSAGKISRDNITEAFRTMTSEGGMFFEGMKKQSLTFQGLVSTLKDNLTLMLAGIGETLLPVVKQAIEILTKLIQGPLGDAISVIVDILAPVLDAVALILEDVLTALMPIFDILVSIMPLISLALKIVVFAVKWVAKIVNWILKLAAALVSKIMPILMFLIHWVKNIIFFYIFLYKQIFRLYAMIFKGLFDLAKKFAGFIGGAVKSGFNKVVEWITSIRDFIAEVVDFIFGLFGRLWNWFANKFPTLAGWIMAIGDVFTNMWNAVKQTFANIWTSIWDAITGSIAKLIGWIDKIPGVDLKMPGIDGDSGITAEGMKDAALPGADALFNPATTAAGNTANVDMQNTINITGADGTNAEGLKMAVEEAARAVFTIEIQKVLVDAGY